MRIFLIITLIVASACSHKQENHRKLASFYEDFVYGDVSSANTQIRYFSPEQNGHLDDFYFFLELKDEQGDYIDRDESEFGVTDRKGTIFPFSLVRIKRGRYYLIVSHRVHQRSVGLRVAISGTDLQRDLIIPTQQVSRKNSRMSILHKEDHRVILQLVLKDHQGVPLRSATGPEILLEGVSSAQVESVEHISAGIWEITVIYPEENQLFYVSVRVQGKTIKKLFRFQHVEI